MDIVGNVVDPNKTTDDADPYVAALAIQLQGGLLSVVVVTDDEVDHMPIRISLAKACDRLGLSHINAEAFLTSVGIRLRVGP